MAKKIIVANWKMAPTTLAEARELVASLGELLPTLPSEHVSVVLCPPFVFLEEVAAMINGSPIMDRVVLGAQDIALDDAPANTGEISGPMLARLGVRYVIIGHSERRWKLGETDEIVNAKLKAALRNNLTPIVCIGERIFEERYQGILEEQIRKTFANIPGEQIVRCFVAYEPVWAISTTSGARPDTPVSALQSLAIIRKTLTSEFADPRGFLYGGSVTSGNIRMFLAVPEFHGVLIGGASVKRDEFAKVLMDASHVAR